MDEEGYLSDPPAAHHHQTVQDAQPSRRLALPVAITLLALLGGAMLLAISFIPTETLYLCEVSFKDGSVLQVGILGYCSQGKADRQPRCSTQIGFKEEALQLSDEARDSISHGLLLQLTFVFIFHAVSGGLAILSVIFSGLGHFLKVNCFVLFGQGNPMGFFTIVCAGLAALVVFGIDLAFLLYANAKLEDASLTLKVPTVILALAGAVLVFAAFILAIFHFNRSYSSGVIRDLGPGEAESIHTETDFWHDGQAAEREEQIQRAQEQAAASLKAEDMKQMNDFLVRGYEHQQLQPQDLQRPTPTPIQQPRSAHTPRALKRDRSKSNKYSKAWSRPTSRFDEEPLPSAKSSARTPKIQLNGQVTDADEQLEALDQLRPLDLYTPKALRRDFKPPPPAPASSRYSQTTGYLQSVAGPNTGQAEVGFMPSAKAARDKANATFEQAGKRHQSVAVQSSVYSQMQTYAPSYHDQ